MPSVGEYAYRMSADNAQLNGAFDSSTRRMQAFDAQAKRTGAVTEGLSKNFEKLGRVVKTVGGLGIALRDLTGDDGGSDISKVTNKVQDFAMAAGIFGGPLVRGLGLGAVALGEGVKFLDRMFNGLSDSEKAALKRQEELKAAREAQRKAIEGTITSLQTELETYGMTARQITEYNLAKQGATEKDMERAKAILDQIDALEKEKKAIEEAAKAEEARHKENLDNMAAIAARRQADEEAIDAFLQERDERARELMENRPEAEQPRALQFGSQAAVSQINEIIAGTRSIEREQLEEAKKMNTKLDNLIRKLGVTGTGSTLQEAVF
jgi:hypothetical protein